MTFTQMPDIMRAIVQDEGDTKTVSVQNKPVPSLEANEVLIKVEYAAQNPTDWKHSAYWSPPGATLGCDFSGTVVRLGPDLVETTLKVGDQVAGCCHGGLFSDKGSFAEYCKQGSDLVFKVPQGMRMEDAATFGVAWVTACQVLIDSQTKPWPPASQNDQWYLICGASSAVGLFTLSLAKAMGYRTIGICSPHSFDLARSYGADELIDYHIGAEAVGEEVKRLSGGGVTIGLDAISEGDSFLIAQAGFGAEGGRLNTILPPPEDTTGWRKDIEMPFTVMYTLFGKRFTLTPMLPDPTYIPASEKDRKFGAEIMARTPELIEKYGIKAPPVEIRGGLEAVLQGFADLKAGNVSGKKLVHRITLSS